MPKETKRQHQLQKRLMNQTDQIHDLTRIAAEITEERVETIREAHEAGIALRPLADLIGGVSPETVRNWINGSTTPSSDTSRRAANRTT